MGCPQGVTAFSLVHMFTSRISSTALPNLAKRGPEGRPVAGWRHGDWGLCDEVPLTWLLLDNPLEYQDYNISNISLRVRKERTLWDMCLIFFHQPKKETASTTCRRCLQWWPHRWNSLALRLETLYPIELVTWIPFPPLLIPFIYIIYIIWNPLYPMCSTSYPIKSPIGIESHNICIYIYIHINPHDINPMIHKITISPPL